MGTFDSMLAKYGALIVGYTVVGLPIFGPGSKEYLQKIGTLPRGDFIFSLPLPL